MSVFHRPFTLSHWLGEFSPFYGRSAMCFPVSLFYNHGLKSGLALPTQLRRRKSAEDLKMKAHRTSLLMENQWSESKFRDPLSPPGGSRNYFVFRPLLSDVKRSVMVPVGQGGNVVDNTKSVLRSSGVSVCKLSADRRMNPHWRPLRGLAVSLFQQDCQGNTIRT